MKYEGVICVDVSEKEKILRALNIEPKDESEMYKEGDTLGHAFTFNNGNCMVIEMCGVNYFEEGGCNTPWTQAVLFDEDGYELCCSEVSEDYFGEWELEYDGDIYSVNIV